MGLAVADAQQKESLDLVGPDGRLKGSFTTEAYRQEALKLMIQEANCCARDRVDRKSPQFFDDCAL